MESVQFPPPKHHFFVCINTRTPGHPTPSCGDQITNEDVSEVKRWIRDQGLSAVIYVTKAKCLGFCSEQRGVVCKYPQGKFVKGIKNTHELKQFIINEVRK